MLPPAAVAGETLKARHRLPATGGDLDFTLSETHRLYQKTVREFCTTRLLPQSRTIDREETIPRDLVAEMGRLGIIGVMIPPDFGGPGGDTIMATIAAEEVGRADVSMATAVYYLLCTGWSALLSRHGTTACRQEVLPKVATGDWFLGIATTEPGGGSDIANIKTKATEVADGFELTGEKLFISGGTEAKQHGGGHLTLARTSPPPSPEKDHHGLSLFYVPTDLPGLGVHRQRNMGRMGISTCGLTYDKVRIPRQYLLGEKGRGFFTLMEGFNLARILVSAACVGCADRFLEMGIEYVKQRETFGRPIARFQGIQFPLVDNWSRLEMVRDQIYKAAWMTDMHRQDGRFTQNELSRVVAIGKLWAPQYALEIAREVMTWYGAAGYTTDYDLEMGYRGILSYVVGAEGALNVMRVIMARELLGKEFTK